MPIPKDFKDSEKLRRIDSELMESFDDLSKAEQVDLLDREIYREKNKISPGEASKIGLHEGASWGTRPTLEGAATGLFSAIGSYEAGKSIPESLEAGKKAFKVERAEEIKKSERAAEQHPKTYYGSMIGGGIVTSPAIAAKGLMGAVKLGAVAGAGQAVGHAESKGEAAGEIAASTALGAATYGLGKAAKKPVAAAFKKIFGAKILSKLAATTSGIDDRFIRDYASRVKKIDAQIKKAGGDWHEVTNIVKEKLMNSIKNTKAKMNKKISTALENVSDEKIFDAHVIIERLNDVRDSLDDATEKVAKKQIQEMIDTVFERSGLMSPTGKQVPLGFIDDKLSVGELFKIKEYLREQAKGTYIKDGQMFIQGMSNGAKRAAKSAAFEATVALNKLSPAIKKANKVLERFHRIDDGLNKSLLKVNAAEGSFIAGGAGLNRRSEKALKLLSKMTGYDALGEAKTIATARAFDTQGIDFRPVGKTGLTLTRMIIGASTGAAAGSGGGPATMAIGMAVGAGLSSPIGVKTMIKSGYLAADVARAAYRTLSKPHIANYMRRAYGEEKYKETLEALRPEVKRIKNKTSKALKELKSKPSKNAEEFLKKGGKIFLENGNEIKEERPVFKKKDGKLFYISPKGEEFKVKSVRKPKALFDGKFKGTILEGIVKPSKKLFEHLHKLHNKGERTPQGEYTLKFNYDGQIKKAWKKEKGKYKKINPKDIPAKVLAGSPKLNNLEVKKGRLLYHDRKAGIVLYLGKLKDLFKVKDTRQDDIVKDPSKIQSKKFKGGI